MTWEVEDAFRIRGKGVCLMVTRYPPGIGLTAHFVWKGIRFEAKVLKTELMRSQMNGTIASYGVLVSESEAPPLKYVGRLTGG